MRELINSKVKCRESFRPFAPSVLADRAQEFFELPAPSPYMQFTVRVKASAKGTPSGRHARRWNGPGSDGDA
jgi:carbamoyltransferase